MSEPSLILRLSRYGAVGGTAALVHTTALLSLERVAPLWLANPLAFLMASIAGYIGHALVTFREETGGRRFARRWLLLQYAVNLAVCALLPLLLGNWMPMPLRTAVLVFTPTLLNALIWSRAARFSAKARQQQNGQPPLLHADDLGLAEGVDSAIIVLAQSGLLQGASLLVNGPSAANAVEAWRDLTDPPPLTLHVCLTEGHGLPHCPDLPTGFSSLLVASLLPWQRRRIAPQLRTVLLEQFSSYRQLTGLRHIRLDGHQHIHLVPLVLDAVLDLSRSESITWVRTTLEALPEGLSLRLWWRSIKTGGFIKWLILQLLSGLAIPRLRRAGLHTNRRFAGVLFSGSMYGEAFRHCWITAHSPKRIHRALRPVVLIHPAQRHAAAGMDQEAFQQSAAFFNSSNRQKEWTSAQQLLES
ncbi:ChbG/HpnK family deacetylase [Synechococcus sp. CC9616]|uniref:ChbG/HpnK family deacetylase n=1 Tax=Synechococcus sp. CC9616 TaxID=110663 RepID=UPI00048C60CE|nr:ChbG/HpnK family deacetylase [Synechococcus sp. CC9616]